MENDLFERIFKYRGTKLKRLEDYCTDIFVYILQSFLGNKNILALQLLNLFGFNCTSMEMIKKITISTRNRYYVDKKPVIPDIEIKLNKRRVFIEVKVNSGLRFYRIKRKTKDQLELYSRIINKRNVYSLTKNLIDRPSISNSHKILWSQICEILENGNNEITINFLAFLKENGMEKSNPIGKEVSSALQEARNLWYLIFNAWPKDYQDFELVDDFTADFIGYIIKFKKKPVIWIGQILETCGDGYIVFQITDDSFIKKLKNKNVKIPDEKDEAGNIIFSKLDISKILKQETETKQRKILGDWIKKNIKKIL